MEEDCDVAILWPGVTISSHPTDIHGSAGHSIRKIRSAGRIDL